MRLPQAFVAIAALSVAAGSSVMSAQRPPDAPQVLIESLAGRDSFGLYCAPCHGDGGRGDGPVASGLRTRPADLTELSRRNDGAFPRETVTAYITGTARLLPAHGTSEMPVWGPMFRVFEGDARVRERISNLVAFIETLQRPSTGSRDPGSQLFRAYCASCHGETGRGDGPVAAELWHTPPDLTQFTQRNGGVFPRERVYRIVDGRDVPGHGDREMPVWGDVFKRAGGPSSQDTVRQRIDAIVRYLEGIQQRSL